CTMRALAIVALAGLTLPAAGAELESRVLTHYVPQDFLEKAVRTEGWTEIALAVKGGVRKGDTVRIWAGGLIDRGHGDQPGENADGPAGPDGKKGPPDARKLALSSRAGHGFALLLKTESSGPKKAPARGKPLEITLTKDKERLWVGFNDERGRYHDNHLGKGRRHQFDPRWGRIEVVRITVD